MIHDACSPESVVRELLIAKLCSPHPRDKFKPRNGQIPLNQKNKDATAFAFKGSNSEVSRLQTLLRYYRGTCNHVAKHLSNNAVRLNAGHAVAANKAEDEVNPFPRGLVISVKNHVS